MKEDRTEGRKAGIAEGRNKGSEGGQEGKEGRKKKRSEGKRLTGTVVFHCGVWFGLRAFVLSTPWYTTISMLLRVFAIAETIIVVLVGMLQNESWCCHTFAHSVIFHWPLFVSSNLVLGHGLGSCCIMRWHAFMGDIGSVALINNTRQIPT